MFPIINKHRKARKGKISTQEGKINTYWEYLFPELTRSQCLNIVYFSEKLDYFLLLHCLVSLLSFSTGLFPALSHMVRVSGFVLLHTLELSTHWAAFQGVMGACSTCHQVYTAQSLNVCHHSGLHSPEQNTTQSWLVLLSGSWTHNKHEAHIKR